MQPRAPHLEGPIPVEGIATAHRQQGLEPLGELNRILADVGLGQGQQGQTGGIGAAGLPDGGDRNQAQKGLAQGDSRAILKG